MKNQYWKHKTSGEIYAIQLEDGHIYSACGPLHHSEINQVNLDSWNFNNDPELVDYIDSDQENYHLYAPLP